MVQQTGEQVIVSSDNTPGEWIYHTDSSCNFIGKHSRRRDPETLRDKYRECKYCSGESVRSSVERAECPYCERTVKLLPNHLPECPER